MNFPDFSIYVFMKVFCALQYIYFFLIYHKAVAPPGNLHFGRIASISYSFMTSSCFRLNPFMLFYVLGFQESLKVILKVMPENFWARENGLESVTREFETPWKLCFLLGSFWKNSKTMIKINRFDVTL